MTHTRCLRAAMLLALAIPAASAAAQRHWRYDGNAISPQPSRLDTTVAFSRTGSVRLSLANGEIVVRGWDQNQVKIHATSEDDGGYRGSGFRFSASPSSVSLEGSYGAARDARFEVTVPFGARISARSMSADVDVRETRGDVEVNSQSGDVRLARVGRVDAGTLSGDVAAQGVNGDAAVRTVSGDFRLEDVTGDVDAESVSGSLDVRGARSRFVRLHTVSGDIGYSGGIDPAGRYELTTHSGEVALTVPPNASAQVRVSTWSGSIDSAFPITLRPGEHGFGAVSTKKFTFDLGGGAARISLETFSGDVRIESAPSPR